MAPPLVLLLVIPRHRRLLDEAWPHRHAIFPHLPPAIMGRFWGSGLDKSWVRGSNA
jgi:hypothetical protein